MTYNLTLPQWTALLWLRKRDPDKNKEFEVAWRPGDDRPTMPGYLPVRGVPPELSYLNIDALAGAGMLTARFRERNVRFILTELGHTAADRTQAVAGSSYSAIPVRSAEQQERVNRLLESLRQSFSQLELEDLCFEMRISFDELKGPRLSDKRQDLIRYCEARGRFSELWETVRQLRPASLEQYPQQ